MRRIWPALLIGLTFPAAGVAPGRAAALAADTPAAPVGAPDSLGVEACVALAREQAPALRAARKEGIEWLDRLGTLVRSGVMAGVRGSSDSIRVALERDAAQAEFESMQLETGVTTLELLGLIGRDPGARLVILEPRAAFDRAPSDEDSLRLMAALERLP